MVALKPFFYFLKNIYRSFCLSCYTKIREIQILFLTMHSNELYQLRTASLVPRPVRAIRVTGEAPRTTGNKAGEVLFKFLASNFIHLYSHKSGQ